MEHITIRTTDAQSFSFLFLWSFLLESFYIHPTVVHGLVLNLGIKHQLIRVFHQEVVRQNKEELKLYLEPQQLALSEAGGGKLVHSVRMLIEERRDFVVVKLDMKSAFNEVSRTSIIEALEAEPTLSHLASFAAIVLAPASHLECSGKVWVGTGNRRRNTGGCKSFPIFLCCLA